MDEHNSINVTKLQSVFDELYELGGRANRTDAEFVRLLTQSLAADANVEVDIFAHKSGKASKAILLFKIKNKDIPVEVVVLPDGYDVIHRSKKNTFVRRKRIK